MKKHFPICCIALLTGMASLSSCLIQQAPAASGTTQGTTQAGTAQSSNTAQQNPLGDILGGVINAAAEQGGGGILGNILASVTGSITTTQNNLIGTWTYTAPAVQFESENLLSQAGGTAMATKIEDKLVSVYKMAGITPGKLSFTFTKDGKVSYTVGSKTQTGTYVFDAKQKVITITTAGGRSINSYITISGANMSLCFDSSKVLSLFSAAGSLSNTSSTLGSIGTIAQSYSGMKTGFKFKK